MDTDESKDPSKSWLENLASKSWSLEMSISGAATFGVSFLPAIIDNGLSYYLENLATDVDKTSMTMPILAYAFFKTMALVLIGTFILHLSLRALWVGAVGLHSAFPNGIQYDKLLGVSDVYKRMAQERFGTMESYIIQLDKRCNSVFALAFLLAMGMAGIGLIYFFIFLITAILKVVLSASQAAATAAFLYKMLFVFAIILILIQLLVKYRPQWERIARMAAQIQFSFAYVFMPFFARPVQYLSMMFMTNSKKKTYYRGMAITLLFTIVSTLIATIQKLTEIRSANLFETRAFYSNRTLSYRFDPNAYDALRTDDEKLPAVSISQDMIDGPYLPVFVRYTKSLDATLLELKDKPKRKDAPVRKKTNEYLDSMVMQAVKTFWLVRIDDSLYQTPQWFFSKKGSRKGFLTYLPVEHLGEGIHHLDVRIQAVSDTLDPEPFGSLPFWKVGSSPQTGEEE
ncbi:MAG: hypothetical protein R2792_05660 [Saprospiraceae bacterium]